MNSRLFYFFCILAMTFSVHAQNPLCPKPIRMGWRENPPFKMEDTSRAAEFRDSERIIGIDIELIQLVVRDVGCEITFFNAPWARQIEAIKMGNLDVISSTSKTAEREQFAYFLSPYMRDTNALFMTAKNIKKYQGKIKSFEDMIHIPNFTLGVTKGNYYGKEFELALKNPQFKSIVKEIKSDNDAILKTAAGNVTAFLGDIIVTFETAKKLGVEVPLDSYPLYITNDNLYFAYSKKSVSYELATQLNESMNKFINKHVSSGAFNYILSKYLTPGQIDMLRLN